MQHRAAASIRKSFLRYFEQHGHTLVPSSSLVPTSDPTLLFTNAGMVQFKQVRGITFSRPHNRSSTLALDAQVFLGHETRDYTRATSSQRCVRAGGKHNDLDQVGLTARHHTSFDMLGNFSFGDYFKEEAIFHAWTVLTKEFELPIDRLHVTVLDNDDEAMLYLELWNLVFMQHNRLADGTLLPLPTPCVDTGMGLERMASVMQGVVSNYHTDVFTPHLDAVASALDAQSSSASTRSFQDAVADELRSNRFGTTADIQIVRVVADHLRTAYALMADGVFPSNVGRGYVLRRILRRAMRFGQQAGVHDPFLSRIPMGVDPAVLVQLQAVVENEEKAFFAMLAHGTKAVDKLLHTSNRKHLTGQEAFFLYDTYGLSIDMTEAIVAAAGATVDSAAFEVVRGQHQAGASGGGAVLGSSSSMATVDDHHEPHNPHLLVPTPFVGYDTTAVKAATVLQATKATKAKNVVALAISPCPFYAEGGGQVGDRGWVSVAGFDDPWVVADSIRAGPETIHVRVQVPSSLSVDGAIAHLAANPVVHANVDESFRQRVAAHHSATHVLQAALREILGPHVTQCGSYVGPDRLRFDFAHFGALTDDELRAVEARVNEVALANAAVHVEEMEKAAALNQVLEDVAAQLNTIPAMVTQKLARQQTHLKALESFNQSLTDRFVYSPMDSSKTFTGTWGTSAPSESVVVQLHLIDDLHPPKADANKARVNLYMTALRRRAEHVAKLTPSAVHVFVMGESVICMGNDLVNAGEVEIVVALA
ncbi:hypothetical protein DYB32_003046 [Aphanomyces invadans]|uniref:alanine--tRNA ligase n=1 Tax=Aphanomyces invadans TaxID=157072 RepID=A0A418B1T0_9STRA|nr:hypothetical protein DYB32_003046 [Aphanomyces invadans]